MDQVKRVPMALVIALILQTIGGLVWAGGAAARIATLEVRVTPLAVFVCLIEAPGRVAVADFTVVTLDARRRLRGILLEKRLLLDEVGGPGFEALSGDRLDAAVLRKAKNTSGHSKGRDVIKGVGMEADTARGAAKAAMDRVFESDKAQFFGGHAHGNIPSGYIGVVSARKPRRTTSRPPADCVDDACLAHIQDGVKKRD